MTNSPDRFVMARRQHGANLFASPTERVVFAMMAAAALLGLYGLVSGAISV